MSFYRDIVRTARKEHKCDLCHGVIHKGEKYHDKAGNSANDESVIYSANECEACQPVITEFMKSSYADEGYCDEWMHEWWRDEKCYDCKSRFLPCQPDEGCKKDFQREDDSCPERTKYGTCKAGDTCDDMTHYCRCEKFEGANAVKE
jgi:hypothetical protein